MLCDHWLSLKQMHKFVLFKFFCLFIVNKKDKISCLCSRTDSFQIWLQNLRANPSRLSLVHLQMNELFFPVFKSQGTPRVYF